jgi:hypothetical protein
MTTCPLKTSQSSIYRTFWSQQDHCAYFKGLLMATNEVCEGIHPQLPYVCVYNNIMPLTIWFITTTPNFWESIVNFFYGLHHRSPMFQVLWLHSCCVWFVDKDDFFYSNHQEDDNWRYYKTFPQQHILQVPWSTTKHCWINSYSHLEGSQSIFLWPSFSNRWTSQKEEILEQSLMYDQLPSKWLGQPIAFGRVAYNNTHHSSLGHTPFLQSMDNTLSLIPWQWVGWIIWL